jgi:hypothetical protein
VTIVTNGTAPSGCTFTPNGSIGLRCAFNTGPVSLPAGIIIVAAVVVVVVGVVYVLYRRRTR